MRKVMTLVPIKLYNKWEDVTPLDLKPQNVVYVQREHTNGVLTITTTQGGTWTGTVHKDSVAEVDA